MNEKYLILDMSNILYRSFYGSIREDVETVAGLAVYAGLQTMNYWYKRIKPTKIIAAFDDTSWRKQYMSHKSCISKKPYKGNRRKNLSPSQLQKLQLFYEHISSFKELLTKYTSVICLHGVLLEADDVIAGWCQQHPNKDNIIVSEDKDFVQLMRDPKVVVYDPGKKKPRSLADWNDDLNLFIFQHCMRGDQSDNIQSAHPRVRKTRLIKAYNDPMERLNMMNETWKDAHNNQYKVGDLFNENKILIDLTCQPDSIRKHIRSTIMQAEENTTTFSNFHFTRYCGKYDLQRVIDQIFTFAPMLSL